MGWGGRNPGGLPSLFSHFKAAGYATSAIGKIHCPEYWVEDATDVFHETCHCSIDGRSAEYTAFLQERGKEELEDHEGLPEFGKKKGRQKMDSRPSPLSFDESQEGWVTNRTIAFMKESVEQGKPFLVHASLPRPHQCTTPSEPFWELYEGRDLTLPPNADYDMEGKAPHMRDTAAGWRKRDWALFEPKTFEAARLRKLRGYLGAVSQVDHAVGLMLEAVDLSHTLCTLAGLDPMAAADGRDLSGLLQGGRGEVRRVGVTEFAWSKSVRKGRYRLVYYPRRMFPEEYPEGFGELYDLEKDPWEMTNLFFDPAHADMVADLQGELLNWLVETTHPTTVLPHMKLEGPHAVTRFKNSYDLDGKVDPAHLRTLRHRNYL